ncbi:GGDEF domain-containing protein [Thermoproteota archaeon]
MFVIVHIIFVLTLIAIAFLLCKKMGSAYYVVRDKLISIETNNIDSLAKEADLRKENKRMSDVVSDTINLYQTTKEICRFLEKDRIFNSFTNGLKEFAYFDDCQYFDVIDPNKDLSSYEVIPLVSKDENYGYLAIRGLKNEERSIVDILVAQFLAGIKRARLYSLVQELSITDELTKTFTRRHFFNRFHEELNRLKELGLPLAFFMIDIDDFKSFNDKYGHIVGDVILRNVADLIKSNSREIDLIGRFGGEEFVVALPITSKEGAIFAAERIRKSIDSKQVKAFDELLNVTISIGIANFPQDAKSGQELIDKADWALYRSKRTGKNKVSVYARYE